MNSGQQLQIQYLDPLLLLQLRSKFLCGYPQDTFAIQFQITIRGGLRIVNHLDLWKIIQQSLPYYDYSIEQLKSLAQLNQRSQFSITFTLTQPFNITCIPHPNTRSLIGNHLQWNTLNTDEQQLMRRLKVNYIEEYLCLRSILLTEQRKTDIQELLTQLDNTTNKTYSKVVLEMFMYYLIRFQFNISIYSNLYDKPFQPLQNLKSSCVKQSIALIGSTFRNFIAAKILVSFGFQVTIFMKNFEFENYYNPITFTNTPNNLLSLLNKFEIEVNNLKTVKYEFYSQLYQCVNTQTYIPVFIQILKEVLKFKDEDSFQEKFFLILDTSIKLPRPQLIDQESRTKRSAIQFLYNKLMLESNHYQSLTTIQQIKRYLTSFEFKQNQTCILQQSAKSFFESNTFYRTKSKLNLIDTHKISNISIIDNSIEILIENKNVLKFNYLIYGDNSSFINSVINNENIKNNPGFDQSILFKIQDVMKSVKIESSIKIIMTFSIRFWGKEKKIVCVHKQTNDYVFFVDASQEKNEKHQNVLIAIMNIQLEEFLKNQSDYEISILKTLSKTYDNDQIDQYLRSFQCIPVDHFIPYTPLENIIQPLPQLYLNIHLSNGSCYDQLNQILEQTFRILSNIIGTTSNEDLKQHQNGQKAKQMECELNQTEDKIQQFFGLNHPLLLSSKLYRQSDKFQLVEPFEYMYGNYMINLGVDDSYQAVVTLPSLFFENKRVRYLFIVLQQQQIYCLIPEDDQTTLLVHSDLRVLYDYCTSGQLLKCNLYSNSIEFNPMFMFPNIYPNLIYREIVHKKQLTQIRNLIEFDDDSTKMAIEEMYREQVGSLIIGVSHPILKMIVVYNQNKTIPKFYEEFLSKPLYEEPYILKAKISDTGNLIFIERKFLSPFCNGIHVLTVQIRRDIGEVQIRQSGEDDEIIVSSFKDLWIEIYGRFIELYPSKFLYQYFKDLVKYEARIQEKYKKWSELYNLMYKTAYVQQVENIGTLDIGLNTSNQLFQDFVQKNKLVIVNQKLFYCFSDDQKKVKKNKLL